jgi:hypothetical protein
LRKYQYSTKQQLSGSANSQRYSRMAPHFDHQDIIKTVKKSGKPIVTNDEYAPCNRIKVIEKTVRKFPTFQTKPLGLIHIDSRTSSKSVA